MQNEDLNAAVTRVYLDLETEDLFGNTLLQIAAINKEKQFNIYINPQRYLFYRCTQITGLKFIQGQLYSRGQLVESVTLETALELFKNWIEAFETPVSIVAFNGLGFDNKVLLKHFLKTEIPLPKNLKQFEDPLPCFKKQLKTNKPADFKLGTLAKHFGISLVNAHDALEDTACLKEICEIFCKNNSIEIDQFLKPYAKPLEHFIKQIENARDKLPTPKSDKRT